MRLALMLVRAVQGKELPTEVLGAALRPSTEPGEIYFTIDLEASSEQEFDNLLEKGRSLGRELVEFLRARTPAFANCQNPRFPEVLGVRECSRWVGSYTLTEEDLVTGADFEDRVAWASWPLELREDTRGPRFQYFDRLEPSGIPLRCLTSSEVPGVYFAGRCLSATHQALASVRVMGTSFATGQAAGIAAALDGRGITDWREQARLIREAIPRFIL